MAVRRPRDPRGVPCLPCQYACWRRSGNRWLRCCQRPVPDRIVVEPVVAALVHGSGDERIASPGCSDRTIRRRNSRLTPFGASGSTRHPIQSTEGISMEPPRSAIEPSCRLLTTYSAYNQLYRIVNILWAGLYGRAAQPASMREESDS